MRALAEYVMRGRTQAVLVAALATGTVLFAWVGAAVVALVTLRKGFSQGGYVLLWTMLPAVVMAAMGDTGPVTNLLGVTMAAMVLKSTSSWSSSLVAGVLSGVITGVVLLIFGKGYIDEILQVISEVLRQISESGSTPPQVFMNPTAAKIAAVLGLSNAFSVLMCLLLARWWQALLYNPGGFKAEFHSLRISPSLAVILLLVGVILSSLGEDFSLWAVLCAVPFVFAGFALVHGVAEQRKISANWLGFFYICWLLFSPLKVALLVLAIADSWLDIRGRLAANQNLE